MSSTDYNQIQLVAFQLGGEEYAVPVQNVESIIRRTRPTRVPGAPSHCLGVINLRGKVISVFDLRRRFSMVESESSDGRVLVVHHDGMNTGVLVDGVSEVLSLDGSALRASPVDSTGSGDLVSGLCRVDDRLVIILDLAAVLSDDIVLSAPMVSAEMAASAVEATSAAVVAAEEIATEAAEETVAQSADADAPVPAV
ncbi:MAG: chemotaxis protein CheW [Actinomycetota bacterium]